MELQEILHFGKLNIRINNQMECYHANILNVEENIVIISLPYAMKNFSISDVVKCTIGDERNSYEFAGEIFDVGFKFPQYLSIYVPGKIRKVIQFRREQRFKTNYLSEVFKLRRQFGCVKDLSVRGICIYTNAYLEIGDITGVKIYHRESLEDFIYFIGIIAWKRMVDNLISYGIETQKIDSMYEDKYFELIEELSEQE